ncbi:MAG: YigZ family protein [Clostridiales bacterium]|jgi:uncharacterized YigZ family protein|nr:YigZ family protein [Clostridiales bacterium]
MTTAYQTIAHEAAQEFVERRSRFIGYAKPVRTEEEALAFLEEIRTRHWDATHNVFAYSLRQGNLRRYSDDGEPQGTAGVPVLDVLQKSGVTDAVLVVTRYFGGVLLGAGGLVRAYSHAASLALQAGEVITMQLCKTARVMCDYNQYGRVSSLIPECGGVVDDTQFTDCVQLTFHMTEEQLSALSRRLADATCGQVSPELLGELYIEHAIC